MSANAQTQQRNVRGQLTVSRGSPFSSGCTQRVRRDLARSEARPCTGKRNRRASGGSLPARRTNPEAWQVAWWPCIKFSSVAHALQPRELAFVEMQSCPRASSRAPRLAQYGPPFPLMLGGPTFSNVLLGDTVMTEKFA